VKLRSEIARPPGPVPGMVRDWLEVNGDQWWWLLVCDKCGKWVDEIDHLAPYHMERNRCYRCDPRKKKEPS